METMGMLLMRSHNQRPRTFPCRMSTLDHIWRTRDQPIWQQVDQREGTWDQSTQMRALMEMWEPDFSLQETRIFRGKWAMASMQTLLSKQIDNSLWIETRESMVDLNLAAQAEWWAQDRPTNATRPRFQVSRLSLIDRLGKWSHSTLPFRPHPIKMDPVIHPLSTLITHKGHTLKLANSVWTQLQSSRRIATRANHLQIQTSIQVLANLAHEETCTIKKNSTRL